QIHVADANSALAATAVDNAYTYLSGLGGADLEVGLGNGQILTPGIYSTGAGAATLNGNIILDGQGDLNSLFIIRIGGAFAVGTFSTVTLINSTLLSNVYWQIGGQFDLGDNSVFRGNLVADGPINLLEGSSLFGRGLSRAGAISLHNNIVSILTPPLPIELLSFDANQIGVYVQLDWTTVSETNNNYFTIQRAKDAIYFEEVVRLNGAGNSNTILNYSAIDYYPSNGASYYRLKQTDFDGKFAYSNIVAVNFEKSLDFSIYPNPFGKSITIIIYDTSQRNNVELRIYNVLGKEVMNTTISKQTTTLETSNLPSGIYFYKLILNGAEGVIGNDKIIQSGKLISQQ
ncbi:MAG: DUF3494 domain-containing protein, partial [Bacteroidetes bacterium]|nr:DUF3494 domain-containing protein [Bacteroidota bacterium]